MTVGIVHPGVPQQLTLFLKTALGLDVFIETGTYLGHSARWAARQFPQVHSIELSPTLWMRARESLAGIDNVHLHCGASPAVLRQLLPSLTGPALLWLDAHWSLGETAGEDDPCPLLAELDVALRQSVGHTLLVDDARLFCSPPALPHPAAAWPSMARLTHTLSALGRDEFFVFEDIIIIPAPDDVELLRKYLQLADTLASQSPLREPKPLPPDLVRPVAAAEALLRQGDAAQALAQAQALLPRAGGAADIADLAARAAWATGRRDEGLAYFAQASRLAPTVHAHHAAEAIAAEACGRRDQARNAAEWGMAVDVGAAMACGLDRFRRGR